MLLESKSAIVYGGGGSIGGAVARAFAAEGARVFLAGRTLGKLETVADAIRSAGGAAHVAELDALTRRVEPSPAENCKPQPEGICSWVPDGISVQPEKRTHASRETWVPAT